VREEAISAIRTRSLPIDIYIWLAYRLHVLTKPTPISWLSLHSQFGAGFKKVRQFKPTMTDALSMALAVYPEAEVSISQDGVTLFPSPPAIPKAEARRLGILYSLDSTDALQPSRSRRAGASLGNITRRLFITERPRPTVVVTRRA
jgi:hypothetical protein